MWPSALIKEFFLPAEGCCRDPQLAKSHRVSDGGIPSPRWCVYNVICTPKAQATSQRRVPEPEDQDASSERASSDHDGDAAPTKF